MLSLHPRYPVLKVPAPARLSAAVAQGLMMPEGGPLWGGNIGLHVSHTIGGRPYPDRLDRRCRSMPQGVGPAGAGRPSHIRRPRYPKRGARPSNRNMRRDFCDLAYIYICTGPTSVYQMAGFR